MSRSTGQQGTMDETVVTAARLPGRVFAFIRLGRPLFLAGGFVMYALGAAAALYGGARLSLLALLWGQLTVTSAQLMVHYANEYYDLAADRANRTATAWSGGSRVLVDESLSPRLALGAGLLFGALAVLSALYVSFVVRPGPLALPLLLLAIGLSWEYSAPPLSLHHRGLGQPTATLVVAVLTPLAGSYLQTGQVSAALVLAIIPLILLQFAMLLAVDVPDFAGDRAAGKRTLVVRLGARRAERLYRAAMVAPYVLLPLLVLAGLPGLVALVVAIGSPVAAWQVARTARGAWSDPTQWNTLIFSNIALLVGTAAAEGAALWWLAH